VCDLALYALKSINAVGISNVRHCLASMTDGSARIASGSMFLAETLESGVKYRMREAINLSALRYR